jgi:hypothetical protein
MCTVCGCHSEQAHDYQHNYDSVLNFATGAAGTSAFSQSQNRLVRMEQDMLASVRSGNGIDAWLEWLHAVAALRHVAR